MKISNASLLDEGTAAEAMGMLFSTRNSEKLKEIVDFLDKNIFRKHFCYENKSQPLGIRIKLVIQTNLKGGNLFGAFFQYQGIRKYFKYFKISTVLSETQIPIVLVQTYWLYFLEAPGKFNVDVVVGTSQRFGIPLVTAGRMRLFATKEIYKRNRAE